MQIEFREVFSELRARRKYVSKNIFMNRNTREQLRSKITATRSHVSLVLPRLLSLGQLEGE